ncbi:MAG: invasion associated locus B family protein, partial [Paracoccaceae bacterium]
TNGTPVADISIFPVLGEEKLKAGATVMTPLGTLLSQNLAIAVDGGKPMVYPYTFCTTEGCAARLALTETEVNSFKRGNEAKLMIVPAVAPDQRVELAISLKGFTAAFEAAQKANAE